MGAFLFILNPAGGVASTIMPIDTDIQLFNASTSGVDVLSLSPPNSAGISINYFSQFAVDDRQLNLINVAGLVNSGGDDGGVAIRPAKLIVIIADTIEINNTIELMGSAGDVLFLSTSGEGSISCNYCNFKNVYRLSLVTATPDNELTEEVAVIGNLTPSFASSISISNLTAAGSIGVDIVSNNLSLNGDVELNQRVVVDANGGYKNDLNGDLVVGTGGVDLLLGPITWNYDNHQIISLSAYNGTYVLGGVIKAAGLKIASTGNLEVNTKVDTRTDLLSSVNYKDTVHVPIEKIDIQTFGYKSLSVLGDLLSDGRVQLKSTEDVVLGYEDVNVDAPAVTIIAEGSIRNYANVNSDYLSVAGGKVFNEGELIASLNLEVWSEELLANQYGGLMKANTIRLESETDVVRNGSRTPYISRDFEVEDMINYSSLESSRYHNPAKMGIFYKLGFDVETSDHSVIFPQDGSAHIIADRIEVASVSFENINPYYVKAGDQGDVTMEGEFANQISIVAGSYIGIATSTYNGYVINSSAQLRVESASGSIEIDTGIMINERYRVLTILDDLPENYVDPSSPYTFGADVVGTRVIGYSPPGFIVSVGDLGVKASHEFTNKAAYIEIFGDAIFDTPNLIDYGFENQGVQRTYNTANSLIGWIYWEEDTVHESVELDSLFSVHGNLIANNTSTWFGAYKPLDYFVELATNGQAGKNWAEQLPSIHSPYADIPATNGFTNNSSIVDGLLDLYEQLKTTVSEFYSEINWWNS
ncbi:hypothetical protein A9Q81_11985 [Gammaproteobacteria bacterium 42_54_T18]|nr:hypothetical protein A9Q81_11985 [Gammaproteobacteria bacterium 42_54_T18]